jgi:hypothetical protein
MGDSSVALVGERRPILSPEPEKERKRVTAPPGGKPPPIHLVKKKRLDTDEPTDLKIAIRKPVQQVKRAPRLIRKVPVKKKRKRVATPAAKPTVKPSPSASSQFFSSFGRSMCGLLGAMAPYICMIGTFLFIGYMIWMALYNFVCGIPGIGYLLCGSGSSGGGGNPVGDIVGGIITVPGQVIGGVIGGIGSWF